MIALNREEIAQLDPSGQQFKLEQSRSDLEQAEQEIAKAQADAAVLAAEPLQVGGRVDIGDRGDFLIRIKYF